MVNRMANLQRSPREKNMVPLLTLTNTGNPEIGFDKSYGAVDDMHMEAWRCMRRTSFRSSIYV